ncbi:MAG: response regulator [Gammaproteobacteria bacterium]
MPASHILGVDDDPAIRQLIADYLTENGFKVSTAADGKAMRQCLTQSPVDLVVLDIRLGQEDGMVLARELRAASAVPIIMLTGRREEADRVVGLELGADDYLTKPFSPRELLARIRAVLRRAQTRDPSPVNRKRTLYRFAGWELDMRTRCLRSPQGAPVALTRGELCLLAAFLSAPQRVLSRDELLDLSRVHDNEVFDRSLDVQILRLRRKIEANPGDPELIKTERGVGYMFAAKVDVL